MQAFRTCLAQTFKTEDWTVLLREENHINKLNDFTVNRKANLFFRKSTGNRSTEAFPV